MIGRRFRGSLLRIALAVFVIGGFVWFFGIRMPGRNISAAATLNESELALRAELMGDVKTLAGDIGERNMNRYPQLLLRIHSRQFASFAGFTASGAAVLPKSQR